MKYLPLIWAAFRRRPTESILIWLAVTVAFTLFGLMAGLNGTYRSLIDAARADHIIVNARFNGVDGLPLALRDPLERIDGVTAVSAAAPTCGYHVNPGNAACVFFTDEDSRSVWRELPITPRQWDLLHTTRNGLLVSRSAARKWNLSVGDTFPLTTAPGLRADGTNAWSLKVVAVVPDGRALWDGMFLIGNYAYLDDARPLAKRATVTVFNLAIRDGSRAGQTARRIDRFFANSGTPTLSISARAAEEALMHSNVDMASMTWTVAGAGLFMILFLTSNGLARSVRERIPEFAVLETLGFTDQNLVTLVFLEAAVPSCLGAVFGICLATALAHWETRFVPKDILQIPQPDVSSAVLASAVGIALLLALVSSAAPIRRLRRLDVAAALGVLPQ